MGLYSEASTIPTVLCGDRCLPTSCTHLPPAWVAGPRCAGSTGQGGGRREGEAHPPDCAACGAAGRPQGPLGSPGQNRRGSACRLCSRACAPAPVVLCIGLWVQPQRCQLCWAAQFGSRPALHSVVTGPGSSRAPPCYRGRRPSLQHPAGSAQTTSRLRRWWSSSGWAFPAAKCQCACAAAVLRARRVELLSNLACLLFCPSAGPGGRAGSRPGEREHSRARALSVDSGRQGGCCVRRHRVVRGAILRDVSYSVQHALIAVLACEVGCCEVWQLVRRGGCTSHPVILILQL